MGHRGLTVGLRKGSLVHVVSASHRPHDGCWEVLHAFFRFACGSPRRNSASREKHMGLIRDNKGNYKLTGKTTEQDILSAAEGILKAKLERLGTIGNPTDATHFLRMRIGALPHEEFHVLWLDNRHRILDCQKLFTGTIDGASIHPREVVRAALNLNAAAAILAHNHPSGVAEPSSADISITGELQKTLRLVGVRVLDHIVISAGECVSMAGRGLL